jgi:dihydropyrimidine dehydrogenase (NADP+)/dihydropyrimidine dehydrogenase (NAD+) subunit PreA
MADIRIESSGMTFPNPFVIGSGPPGTNYKTIAKCFRVGWGGVVAKTVSLNDTEVVNVAPRYGKHRLPSKEVIGFQNIELISDRSLDDWLDDFKRCKDDFPDHVLIASIMEQYAKDRWQELTQRIAECGVDGFELNFSCPHGHPETNMGAAMGQDPGMVEEVTKWVVDVTDKPVWAKMTPNIGDIRMPARAAMRAGAAGVSAINTILAVIGVDLKTLRPQPTVEGHSTPGGYSYAAVKPIALRMVAELCLDAPDMEVSGIGGVVQAEDAIEHLLLGASTVQVCTGAMLHGHAMVQGLIEGLHAFMEENNFETVRSFVGKSLPYFTTHHDLVDRQREAKATRAGLRNRDMEWGDDLSKTTDELTTN